MSRLAFVAAWIMVAPGLAHAGYFAGAEDVPLPPGFTEVAMASRFETEDGSILVAHAEGRGSFAQVQTFYDEALPQLGWAFSPGEDGALVFHRGRETLSFVVREGAQRTSLSVRLVLRSAPTSLD